MLTDVSLIITSYNVERYIARAVSSALAQQGVALEVIVVDDASSDGTWAILSGIADARVRLFRLAQNSGPGAARNKGFAEARGEWIAVLDGDDALEPTRLQRCIQRAKEMKADIVVDNLLVCREADGKEFPMFPPHVLARLSAIELPQFIRGTLSRWGGYTLGYLKPVFSAAFVRAHGLRYDETLRIGEDYLMMAEALALKARCAVEPEAGYRYTVRAGSISHRLTLRDIDVIEAADTAFMQRFALDAAAMKAQASRMRYFREMRSCMGITSALKARAWGEALSAIVARPLALRLFVKPLWKRLCRGIR